MGLSRLPLASLFSGSLKVGLGQGKQPILSVDVTALSPQCGLVMTVTVLADLFCRTCAAFLCGLKGTFCSS